jgi:outer membrane lipoprotein SlyB
MMSRCHRVSALTAVLLLAGCASEDSGSGSRPVYTASQAGQVISQDAGMVTAVEEVVIQGSSSYPGAPGTGSQLGSAVGRSVLSGDPLAMVGAIGGIMGGKAGANLDNQIGDKITITLDSGKTITVVQARDKQQPIMPGERVVIESGSTTSVVREVPAKDPEYTAAKKRSTW